MKAAGRFERTDADDWQRDFANAEHIVSCVNGCRGLNPAAFKALLQACKALLDKKLDTGMTYEDAYHFTFKEYELWNKLAKCVDLAEASK